jgi:hypothetical protein
VAPTSTFSSVVTRSRRLRAEDTSEGSVPREGRLLDLGNTDTPAVHGNFAELVQNGGGGGVDCAAEQGKMES